MSVSYGVDSLSAVEVCFAQASKLLYFEPSASDVSLQTVDHVFASAPYGMDDEDFRDSLKMIDTWLSEVDPLVDASAFEERVAGLRREWFQLFLGPGTPSAPCWESFYREPNSHLFGERTLQVRAYYRRHGMQIENLRKEPDDHLGLMLGFVGYLVGAEADALFAKDTEKAAELAREQDDFMAEHVLPWLPAWKYGVDKYATSDYFRGVGQFVFGLCALYMQRFGVSLDAESNSFKRKAC